MNEENKELFKQALIEGVNRRIDKTIEIEVITYEQDRLNHFIDLMEKARKKYDGLYKRYKESPYLSEGTTLLSDAGRELQFYKDVIAMLEQGNRKWSEWISVDERLPEVYDTCLVAIQVGEEVKIDLGERIKCFDTRTNEHYEEWLLTTNNWGEITHWMPLPEAPKMKGGE